MFTARKQGQGNVTRVYYSVHRWGLPTGGYVSKEEGLGRSPSETRKAGGTYPTEMLSYLKTEMKFDYVSVFIH